MKEAFSIGCVCLLAAAASAGARSEPAGEILLAEIPSGYELAHHQETTRGEIKEFIPRGEVLENWSEMLTVQVFPAGNSVDKFYAAFDSQTKQACEDGTTHVVATAEENGYPVKFFQLYCPANTYTGLGEVTFVKSMEGRDAFYVVQKAWRTPKYELDQIPLTSDDIIKWTQYMRFVRVCDSRVKTQACP